MALSGYTAAKEAYDPETNFKHYLFVSLNDFAPQVTTF